MSADGDQKREGTLSYATPDGQRRTPQPRVGRNGKRLVVVLVALGVIAAVVGLKFRVLSPRPAEPAMTPPTTDAPSP